MQRPTTHRHHSAESISVADLIRRQSAKGSPVAQPPLDDLVDEPADDLYAEEPASGGRLGKAAKLVGLAAGALVLFASVAAASVITDRQPAATNTASANPFEITGVNALRPDLLGARLEDSSGQSGSRRQDTVAAATHTTAPTASAPSESTTATTDEAAASPRTMVSQTPARSPVSVPVSSKYTKTPAAPIAPVDVVRDFYQLVVREPSAATELLDPVLLDSDPLGFVRSWSSVRDVQLDDVQQQSDYAVLAIVNLQQADGEWLRVTQLLHFADAQPPRIIGAEVLAAQRI